MKTGKHRKLNILLLIFYSGSEASLMCIAFCGSRVHAASVVIHEEGGENQSIWRKPPICRK
jgi:hypothetical protein